MAQPTVPRTRRLALAMKAEATFGTDIFAGTYTAADVVPCFNINPSPVIDEIPNLSLQGLLGKAPSGIGQQRATVSFSMYARGAGAAYSASVKPEADNPLQGCGLSSTGSFGAGVEKYTYAPTLTFASYTIYACQENGRTLKLTGCFGDVNLTMRAGGVLQLDFTFSGTVAAADVTYVSGTFASTPQYPVAKSALFQIDASNYAPRIAQLGFRVGNQLNMLNSINAAAGLAGFFISDRDPRLTIDPEADTAANYDWFTKWTAGNLAACTFQCGSTQYNRILFSLPKTQIVDQKYAARDGLTSFPTTLLATVVAGNDDFSLVFS